tara:strand:- start:271 stop:672 length:402 start_codon:yes stop_codon:yes gene_type:complete
MIRTELQLPSNKKFGFFFTAIFIAACVYFNLEENFLLMYIFSTLSGLFLLITLINSDILQPLNNLWMQFGMLLGNIVSPIVMGIIFFGLFTPISLVMRLTGRDELRLRFKDKSTHWIPRKSIEIQSSTFKNQF